MILSKLLSAVLLDRWRYVNFVVSSQYSKIFLGLLEKRIQSTSQCEAADGSEGCYQTFVDIFITPRTNNRAYEALHPCFVTELSKTFDETQFV
jgi:hypothetical protein